MELTNIITDLADALKAVDSTRPIQGKFKPGIGPHKENIARNLSLSYLQKQVSTAFMYKHASTKKYPASSKMCDLVIPEKWAIELKLLRPFGDNDKEAEHWSSKIIHPYYGNKSAIGDMLKLLDSGFACRKAIILFAYEHSEPKIDQEITLKTFEMIASACHQVILGQRIMEERRDLVHPTFAVLKVIGWEIINHK
jgi:hypothetical protein